MNTELENAYEVCRQLHAEHGKSYYFATKFFPADLRLATYALYAFFRLPDEIVDNPKTTDPKRELERFRDEWRNGEVTQPVLLAARDTFKRHHIPSEYSESFLDAMIQDTWKKRYASYAELEQYMYGSAAVVGLMMSHVIGFKKEALVYAEKLGYAMQLTNFLRDIREDLEKRDRIYFPQDELARYGITEDELRQHRVTAAFEAFMKFQIARADRLYEEANVGIRYLNPRGRFAVRMASDLYRAILRKIEQQRYNVFVKRASTSKLEKVWIALRSRFLV
jgi:phytoene synthase